MIWIISVGFRSTGHLHFPSFVWNIALSCVQLNASQFLQKIISKCNCFIQKSEHSFAAAVLSVTNQNEYTLTNQLRI